MQKLILLYQNFWKFKPHEPLIFKKRKKRKKKNSIAPSSFSSYYALIFSFSAADWRSTLIFGYLFFCR